MDFQLEELGLNEHNIGVIMREAVRRACAIIRKQRFTFTAQEKEVSYKTDTDYVTSADYEAQTMYLAFLKKNFPKFGIIAEENELFTEASSIIDRYRQDHFFYFTIDPLDGTKAYKRLQSDGFSSMLSLIHRCPSLGTTEVVASCIGDPMTYETYYTRPGSPRVHLLQIDQESSRKLSFDPQAAEGAHLLMRDSQRCYSPVMRRLGDAEKRQDRFFKGIQIAGGSIGLSYAKLWKGEYAGIALKAGMTTVWDTAPLVGICKKLGFVQLAVIDGKFIPTDFVITTIREDIPQAETLIVHESLVPKIQDWAISTAVNDVRL